MTYIPAWQRAEKKYEDRMERVDLERETEPVTIRKHERRLAREKKQKAAIASARPSRPIDDSEVPF